MADQIGQRLRIVLSRFGDWAHGGERLDDIAQEWREEGFDDPDVVEQWLTAGCFDPGSAAMLRDNGVDPIQAARRIELHDQNQTIAFWLSNGDLNIDSALERLAQAEREDLLGP